MKIRLIREENATWIEKAVITHIWISTSNVQAESALEQLQQMFDTVLQESNSLLSAPATHAAQTLLWKKVEDTWAQEQQDAAEAWCRLCLHPLLEKAGAQNKVKITRCVAIPPFSTLQHITTDRMKEDHSICAVATGLCRRSRRLFYNARNRPR
jgi:hypothetical protein